MLLQVLKALPSKLLACNTLVRFQQVRNKYKDMKMYRDQQKRFAVAASEKDRIRLNAIRKNDILPEKIRIMASDELHAFPRDTCRTRLVNRCILTSRPQGAKAKWRIHRMMVRKFMDANQLSGMQRAMW